jgi:hypothetical protein
VRRLTPPTIITDRWSLESNMSIGAHSALTEVTFINRLPASYVKGYKAVVGLQRFHILTHQARTSSRHM